MDLQSIVEVVYTCTISRLHIDAVLDLVTLVFAERSGSKDQNVNRLKIIC